MCVCVCVFVTKYLFVVYFRLGSCVAHAVLVMLFLTLSRHMMHVLYINCLYYLMFYSYYVITKQVVSLFVVNTCFVLSLYFLLCLMFVLECDGCL